MHFCPPNIGRRRLLLTAGTIAATAAVPNLTAEAGAAEGTNGTDDRGRRIDVHHHVVPPAWLDWATAQGLVDPAKLPWWARWDLQADLSTMDKAGIALAVASGAYPVQTPYKDDAQLRESMRVGDEAMAELVRARPDRFAFFAVLPLERPEIAVERARAGLDDLGAAGVTLTTGAGGKYLGDGSFEPVLAELDARAAVAFVHPQDLPGAPPAPGLPSFLADYLLDTTRAEINLIIGGALDRHTKISFIFTHGGGFLPYMKSRLEATVGMLGRGVTPEQVDAAVKRFYYDTAAPMSPSQTPSLLATAGHAQLIYGSDYPAATTEIVTKAAAALDADPALTTLKRAAINRANAVRLLTRLKV